MRMNKILVSACLIGENVRYNGREILEAVEYLKALEI